ncbi:unnamed protein product [Auanema sp. JU1783]|nr:unnamed protein product [Auanema sp. JU1783]
MIGSDEETDSEDEDFTKKLLNRQDEKKKNTLDIEERDSSGSDSDADPDKEKIDHVVFIPSDEPLEEGASSTAKKRPAGSEAGGEAKKAKTETNVPDGLNEETVRKYLRRKPHTTKELLTKVKAKCGDMSKSEIVTKLAAILRTIEPHQFKQKQGRKDVLFFSLTNNMA